MSALPYSHQLTQLFCWHFGIFFAWSQRMLKLEPIRGFQACQHIDFMVALEAKYGAQVTHELLAGLKFS